MRKLAGFTLIELLIVLVISGLIVGAATKFLAAGLQSYTLGKRDLAITLQVPSALERLVRELRFATNLTAFTASSLEFQDANGELINYSFAKTTGQVLRNGQVMAAKMGALEFTYYDGNFNPTNNLTQIKHLRITLKINYTNFTTPCSTMVTLWNLI